MSSDATFRFDSAAGAATSGVGAEIYDLVRRLFPLNRSITGDGLRQTLRTIGEMVPLQITEIPTGTRVFDWVVPPEWSVDEAYIEAPDGSRFADFAQCNLHLVGYSVPVDLRLPLADLKRHLHTLPDRPDWIPYRTSYYKEAWGFCVPHRLAESLPDGQYHAVVRSRLGAGSLTIGECYLAGQTTDEVLIFAHCCHPSLCNDNLSGVGVATHLARILGQHPHRYSYRFVFAPATIGSISWLAMRQEELGRIRHGLVLSLLGDRGEFHYKMSRDGNAEIDAAAAHVLTTGYPGSSLLEFSPWGYDERQFGSPGVRLPVGRLTRTPNGEFPEYHTSADNLSYVSAEQLEDAMIACLRVLDVLEGNGFYLNCEPRGEPQLGRRGLYRSMGGYQEIPEMQNALLWVLNQSDGTRSLLDVARRAKLPFGVIREAADKLAAAGLIRRLESQAVPGDAM